MSESGMQQPYASQYGQAKVYAELDAVRVELIAATEKFSTFASAHEGYAVILEELDEAWQEIKRNDAVRTRAEMIQVAAMAVRFLLDVPADES